jgi:hypothetical protein
MYERMRPLHRPNPSPPSPLHQAWRGRTVSVQPPPPELPQFLQMGRRWVEETDQLPPPPLCSLPSLRRKMTSRAEEEEKTGTRRGVGVAAANLRARSGRTSSDPRTRRGECLKSHHPRAARPPAGRATTRSGFHRGLRGDKRGAVGWGIGCFSRSRVSPHMDAKKGDAKRAASQSPTVGPRT